MSNAVATLTYALSAPIYPAGSAVASTIVSISDAAATPPVTVSQTVAPGTATVTFLNVAPGTYMATAQDVDASGAALGSGATTTFTITAPATIALSLVSAVTVAQA